MSNRIIEFESPLIIFSTTSGLVHFTNPHVISIPVPEITCTVRGEYHAYGQCDTCGGIGPGRCQWTIYQQLQFSCIPRCYNIHEWQKKVRREKKENYEPYKGKDFS